MSLIAVEDEEQFNTQVASAGSGHLVCVLFQTDWQQKTSDGVTFGKAELSKLAEGIGSAAVSIISVNAGSEEGEELAMSLGVSKFPAVRVYCGSVTEPVLKLEGLSECQSLTANSLKQCYAAGLQARVAASGQGTETNIRDAVRAAYTKTVTGGAGVLPQGVGDPQKRSKLLGYNQDDINASADLGLGCGNPLVTANLQPGEVVLDLGSGAGMDCFIAAKEVGHKGMVIGVDMTPDMLSKARATAKKDGVTNVSFRLGEIEHLPVGDEVINCLISNCVINLSTEKDQVYREMNRVLVPGGRISISDVLRMNDIPKELQTMESYACWVSGASAEDEMLAMLTSAGFTDIKIQIKENAADIISGWMPGSGAEKYITSAYVTATKPLQGGSIRDDVLRPPNPSDIPMDVDSSPAVGCWG